MPEVCYTPGRLTIAPGPLKGERMGKMQKEKGKRGERELARKFQEYGYPGRRGQQYCGADGDADVVGLPDIHVECKRVERLDLLAAMDQAVRDARCGEIPAVFHRKDRSRWLVTMSLDDWIKLYREWEAEMALQAAEKEG